MATVKKTEAVEANEEKTVEPYSWEDMREIILPKDTRDGRKSQYVSINGREFGVPRGQRVKVPYPVYERLQIMLEAQATAEEIAEQIPNRI